MDLRHLAHLESAPSGREWLSAVPAFINELVQLWELKHLAAPFTDGSVSYVAKAERHAQPVVLKIQWPHEECLYEADALECWGGEGAIKLLAKDNKRHALLLEHCDPGQSLGESECSNKLDVVIHLLPKLWVPVNGPFKTLADEARGWQSQLYDNWHAAGQPVERLLVDKVHGYINQLLATPLEQVLVHQDLHGGNILSAQRASWLAIDPKPLIGEREFSIASMVRSAELGHSRELVIERLTKTCHALQLNVERARQWSMVQTLCWSFDADSPPTMLDVVHWLDVSD